MRWLKRKAKPPDNWRLAMERTEQQLNRLEPLLSDIQLFLSKQMEAGVGYTQLSGEIAELRLRNGTDDLSNTIDTARHVLICPTKNGVGRYGGNGKRLHYDSVVVCHFLKRAPDVGVIDITAFENIVFEQHRHESVEVRIVYSGEVKVDYNGRTETLLANQSCKIDAQTPHSVAVKRGSRFISIVCPYIDFNFPKIVEVNGEKVDIIPNA